MAKPVVMPVAVTSAATTTNGCQTTTSGEVDYIGSSECSRQ